jgi:dihydrofolate reductase
MGVSADGYMVGPDGRFDWSEPDAEHMGFVLEEIRDVGVHLLGRRLYETMVYWEAPPANLSPELVEWGGRWRALPKVVFSTTLTAAEGNTRLLRGGLIEEIERLKADPSISGNIAIGGAGLAAQVAEADLIDEYLVRVYPVLVGGGLAFFPQQGRRHDLELIDTHRFSSGVVSLHYRVRRLQPPA